MADGPGDPAPRGLVASPNWIVPVVLAVAATSAVAIGFGVFVGQLDADPTAVAVGLGLATGAGLGLLAITRFAAFVFVLLAIRSSLDSFKLGELGTSSITEPSVIVGAVLLLASALWLLTQLLAGELRPLSRTARWLLAYGVVAVVSALGSAGLLSSLQSGLRVLAGALTFVALEQLYGQRPERIGPYLLAATLSLAVPAAVAIGQIIGSDELYVYTDVVRIQGTFVHPNSFAAYLVILCVGALAVAPAVGPRWRRYAIGVGAVAGALALFTYARGAWIALAVGLLYLIMSYRRRLLPMALVAGLVLVLALPSVRGRFADLGSSPAPNTIGDGTANSLEWRFDYWQRILPLGLENPVTGLGLDQVPTRTADGAQPHNGFVQAAVETGLLGLIALVGLAVAMGLDLRAGVAQRWPGLGGRVALGASAVAIGILLQMLTENLLTQVAIHIYLWVPVAYVCARVAGGAESSAPPERRPGAADRSPLPSPA
jgi:O-antigen ligase